MSSLCFLVYMRPLRRVFMRYLLFLPLISVIPTPLPGLGQQPVLPKLTLVQVEQRVVHGVPDSTMAGQIQRRGLAFAVTPAILDALQRKGAGPQTLAAIQGIAPASGVSIPDTLGDSKNANGSSPSGGWRQASDLQHCVHLILQVEVKEAVAAETDNTIARLQRDLKTANIGVSQALKPDWSGRPGLVEVDGVEPKNLSSVRAVLNQKYAKEYDINSTGQGAFKLTMRPLVEKALNEKTLQQAIEVIRRRMDVLGVKEPLIREYNLGANQILVEMPGITDLDHVKRVIQSTARIAIHAVKGDPSGYPDEQSALAAIGGLLPPDEMLVHGTDRVFILQRVAIVSGSDFRSAEPGVNQTTGHPVVNFMLTNGGGDRFYDFTSTKIGKSMAVVMGGRVREVANIKSAIRDSGQIEGAFTQEEVMDLSKLLHTGALPASLDFLDERNVCPSSSLGPTR
jgi:protein-export membrane protein SecD